VGKNSMPRTKKTTHEQDCLTLVMNVWVDTNDS
jgi:hypothetical protein